MRPRVFPAEDDDNEEEFDTRDTRFNEAAGIPRGRRARGVSALDVRQGASMRPRVFPAEDIQSHTPTNGRRIGLQ